MHSSPSPAPPSSPPPAAPHPRSLSPPPPTPRRYVTAGAFFESARAAGLSEGDIAAGDQRRILQARWYLYQPGGAMARELAKNPTVLVVNGQWAFAHGGLLPHHLQYGLQRINDEAAEWMLGAPRPDGSQAPPPFPAMGDANSVQWNRTFGKERVSDCECSARSPSARVRVWGWGWGRCKGGCDVRLGGGGGRERPPQRGVVWLSCRIQPLIPAASDRTPPPPLPQTSACTWACSCVRRLTPWARGPWWWGTPRRWAASTQSATAACGASTPACLAVCSTRRRRCVGGRGLRHGWAGGWLGAKQIAQH